MASAWAEEAERQARAITRDLVEVGRRRGFRVTYQKREARFALRAGTVTAYFSAHDYTRPDGEMDWLRLRIDVLTRVSGVLQAGGEAGAQAAGGEAAGGEAAGESLPH